jgi:hypothetical protein
VLYDLSLCQEWQNILATSDVSVRNELIFGLYKILKCVAGERWRRSIGPIM